MAKDNIQDNIDINEKEGYISIHLNPNIYPLDVIYSAAYVFLDKAYVFLDGDPKKEVIIHLRLKEKKRDISGLNDIANNFGNELINYAFYKKQSEKNAKIREAMIQRVLLTNYTQSKDQAIKDKISQDIVNEDLLEDPEGIAIPWEEKYGEKGKEANEKREGKRKDECN